MASDRKSKLDSELHAGDCTPERLALAFHDASRAFERLLIAQTRASGLGMLEFLVLARAVESGDVTSGEIGRSLGLSTSTMTGLVDRLARDELVRRHPHPTDGRLLLLRATPKGKRVHERSVGPTRESVTREAATLGAAESGTTARFLDRVTELLGRHAEELQNVARATAGRAATPRRARSQSG